MKFAQRETVRYDWLALRMTVREDVGCVKQLLMPQIADGACSSVRGNDTFSERSLMDSLEDCPCRVQSARVLRDREAALSLGFGFVGSDDESSADRIIAYDVYRPRRQVSARNEPVEVNHWDLLSHGGP